MNKNGLSIYSIYIATNKINGKVYVGFDKMWPTRKRKHEFDSFNTGHPAYNFYFHRAIRKYGIDAFEWKVIYQSKEKMHTLKSIEPHFIKEYNSYCGAENHNGYNMTPGGDGYGRPHTEETKQKLRNRTINAETRKRMSLASKGRQSHMKGKHHTESTKLKISTKKKGIPNFKLKGRKLPSDQVERMRISSTGRKLSEEAKKKVSLAQSKNWTMINPLGEVVKIFNLKCFCEENNLNYNSMCRVAKGKLVNHKGYKCYKQQL